MEGVRGLGGCGGGGGGDGEKYIYKFVLQRFL